MPRLATPIVLNRQEQAELERLVRCSSTPQSLALRTRIILLAGEGAGVIEIAERLSVWRKGVSHWRSRWIESSEWSCSVWRAFERRTPLWLASQDHARTGLFDCRTGL